jgi:putative Ca2+/H+ antiporter (TMEM165/GDT1 family)
MNFAVLDTVFGVIFVAELPDKTAIASLVLGTKYRASWVFGGVAAAFGVHVVLAMVAGSLLGLLPHRATAIVVGVLFALGAVLMLRRGVEDPPEHRDQDLPEGSPEPDGHLPGPVSARATTTVTAADRTGFWRVVATSFTVLFVAEFGDLTQIATANLAARYHDPLSVGIGAVLGLWAVGGLAITGGQQLLRLIPMIWIVRIAAAVMTILAVLSIVDAITG